MRKLQYLFMTLSALLIAVPAFGQGADAASQWVPLAAGLGMALAAGLCGLGQGKATASATEALARNPGARPGIFIFLILHRVAGAVHLRHHLPQGEVTRNPNPQEASALRGGFFVPCHAAVLPQFEESTET
jgi:F-type H+-transporting ATPase subunit c